MDNIEQIIKEQLVKLPEDVRKAISSVDLRDKVKKISEKHHLHIDQAGILETETVLVMLGLESTDNYRGNLKKELQISDTSAQAITFDVNKEIFMPIRESLKKISQEPASEVIKGTPKAIHHLPLTESEEIKKQIKEQQAVKPTVVPPPNLPTQPDSTAGESSRQTGVQVESTDEQKKPSHVDPYREPIE